MAGIYYEKGDIFASEAQVIVNTVNCKGVMGKGLALAFKQRYPKMFPIYKEECRTGKLRIGRPSLYRESTPWILNFPTKDNWRSDSKIEYLEEGLKYFSSHYKQAGITSIAFPKLGAQNGRLSWEDVGPLMIQYLSKLDIDVYIYIAEGDTEFGGETKPAIDTTIWLHFNEISLSPQLLQEYVKLSNREAQKIFQRRSVMEFTSLSDIASVEGLAKISLQRIKDYIQSRRYPEIELPGLSNQDQVKQQPTPNQSRSTRKKRQGKVPIPQTIAAELFPLKV